MRLDLYAAGTFQSQSQSPFYQQVLWLVRHDSFATPLQLRRWVSGTENMLVLQPHKATAEQLPIISGTRMGIEVIRGAAGSGKTTTALLRLESLAHTFIARRRRLEVQKPVKVLVITFNRTLAGYVEQLATVQLENIQDVTYSVSTFAAWSSNALGDPQIIDDNVRESMLRRASAQIRLPPDFALSEMEYIIGRFEKGNRQDYIAQERTGRGASPAVPRTMRPDLLAAIEKYEDELSSYMGGGYQDWGSLCDKMLKLDSLEYDVVIIDEAQDFSANQIRALKHHLATPHCFTLVIDTAQRLYPRGFTWAETGLDMQTCVYHRLKVNHRNSKQIADFARGILEGLQIDDDGTLPELNATVKEGELPVVIKGKYGQQLAYAVDWIKEYVDLETETVAFLKPRGKGWFDDTKKGLDAAGLEYFDLTRCRNWPSGGGNVALCTMNSAKGLEFDHVIVLGLSGKNTPHGVDQEDDELLRLRRLLGMALGRAKKTVMVGYKPGEESDLISFFKPGTFLEISL
ncbi:3'-5' exonuclease [Pseudomonas syringae]|nr:3'-5' exonuclease [Pseudomonas syringae]